MTYVVVQVVCVFSLVVYLLRMCGIADTNNGAERKTRYKRLTLTPCVLMPNSLNKRLCVEFDVLLRNLLVLRHM